MTEAEFLDGARANPSTSELLTRLRSLGVRDCYLTAGCLFQPIWNHISGRAADWGVKDYDVFYFDNADPSWEAEDEVIRLVESKTADLSIAVEVRNQARVHLWYPERFGGDYPRLGCARDGIDRFLISCTCVGIEVHSGQIYAPNGFEDLARGLLRMNPLAPNPNRFREKARSYQSRWPWLTILD
ncbi:MAG: nucleotidyltransferase family protein [Caulobacteraceae bacterium]